MSFRKALSLLISLALAAPGAAVAQPRAAVPAVHPIGNVAPARVLLLEAFSSPLTTPVLSPGAAPTILHPALNERMAVFLQRTAAAAPTQAPAAKAPLKSAKAVQVLAAANRKLALFTPEQLGAMPPEELNNLAGQIMDGAGTPRPAAEVAAPAPAADLPPTSLRRTLSKKDIQHVLAATTPMRPNGFQGTSVEKILTEGLVSVDHFSQVLYDMYHLLSEMVKGPDSNQERSSLAIAIQDRYVKFLSAARAAHLSNESHVAAGRVLHRFFKSGALIEDLFRAREVATKIEKLDRLLAMAPQTINDRPKNWKIPSRLPDNQRIRDDEQNDVVVLDLKERSATIDQAFFKLEQSLKRAEMANKDPRFSAAFRAARSQDLAETADRVRLLRLGVASNLEAYRGGRLNNQFVAPPRTHYKDAPPQWHLHPGLKLTSSGNNFVLKARFASSIAETKVHEFVKASIEDYWRVSFTDGNGRPGTFRTEVSIRALKPGEAARPDELRLSEHTQSQATGDGFTLERDLRWATPAHEFGHVLGLPDEYTVEYDVRRRLMRESQPRNSLMGGGRGTLRPHHLKRALQRLIESGRYVSKLETTLEN
jgi:hypothetical protein